MKFKTTARRRKWLLETTEPDHTTQFGRFGGWSDDSFDGSTDGAVHAGLRSVAVYFALGYAAAGKVTHTGNPSTTNGSCTNGSCTNGSCTNGSCTNGDGTDNDSSDAPRIYSTCPSDVYPTSGGINGRTWADADTGSSFGNRPQ